MENYSNKTKNNSKTMGKAEDEYPNRGKKTYNNEDLLKECINMTFNVEIIFFRTHILRFLEVSVQSFYLI